MSDSKTTYKLGVMPGDRLLSSSIKQGMGLGFFPIKALHFLQCVTEVTNVQAET